MSSSDTPKVPATPAPPPLETKSPEQLSAEASERIRLAGVAAQAQVEVEGAKATIVSGVPLASSSSAPAIRTISSMTSEELEAEIARILGMKKKEEAKAALTPKVPEPDWATLTEREALDLRVSNIPIFEHEVPSYMDLKSADPEYEIVWANRDQRRLGQLLAEGYELLKREHVDPTFQIPLKFDSEGLYVYIDVIAMRVHKRILFGKRRKVIEKSFYQLKRQEDFAKSKLAQVTARDPHLEEAFAEGSMEYYTT